MATIEMPEPTAVANLSAQTAYAAWTIRNALVDAQKFLLPKAGQPYSISGTFC